VNYEKKGSFYETLCILFVPWRIWKCFKRKFVNLFEDVRSLHMCFSADLSRILHCIMHANVWDVFGPTQYIAAVMLRCGCWCCRLGRDVSDEVLWMSVSHWTRRSLGRGTQSELALGML